MKFATKLTLFFMGFFLIACVAIMYTTSNSAKRILEEEIGDKLEEQAFNAMDKIDRVMYMRLRGLGNFKKVRLPEFKQAAKTRKSEPLSSTLKGFVLRTDFFTSMSFFDMDRVRIADSDMRDIGAQHGFNEYFPEISAGSDAVFGMYASESRQEPQFHFAQVVRDESAKPIGIFVARITSSVVSPK